VGEVITHLGLALACSMAGYLLAGLVQAQPMPAEFAVVGTRTWRAVLCVWALVLALVGGSALVSVLGWLWASREEARLFLQDQLWTETRSEQRTIQRWAMWTKQQEGEP
jgi:hypothetical protein